MTDLDVLQLSLTISAPDNDDDRLDDMTRQLLMELKNLDVESVKLAADGHAPAGTKGVDPVTAGTIALAVLPTMLPKVLEFLQSWTLQGKGRTIKFKGKVANQQIEFEGSLADMEKLLAKLEKKKVRSKK
jgi:uncharacterized protein YsxB (DUF464 family)